MTSVTPGTSSKINDLIPLEKSSTAIKQPWQAPRNETYTTLFSSMPNRAISPPSCWM